MPRTNQSIKLTRAIYGLMSFIMRKIKQFQGILSIAAEVEKKSLDICGGGIIYRVVDV